jgi:hypothetical protein
MASLNISNASGKPLRFTLETSLECSLEAAWEAVQRRWLLEHVTHPLLKFLPAQPGPLPERLEQGDTLHVNLYVLGFIPFGKHTIHLEHVQIGQLISREHGTFINVWNHIIEIEATPNGTHYRDRLEIEAGWLTPVILFAARLFYRHRQARWRALAPKLDFTKAVPQ